MPSMEKAEITPALVSSLVAAQFPQWAGLPITRLEVDGNDNTTFRLGEEMSVRLPSAERYVAQVDKEQRWLPILAGHLPLPIPQPLARGAPGSGYPWPWSVYRWLGGSSASVQTIGDEVELATTLADFLAALYRIDPAGGPPAGHDNFFRGAPLATYDAEARNAIAQGERPNAAVAVVDEAMVARAHDRVIESNDPTAHAVVVALREHGQRAKYRHELEGYTARLDTVQALVLLRKLPLLDGWNGERRQVAAQYGEQLADVGDLRLPPVPEGSEPVWHLYPVWTERPEALATFLAGRGIATGRHYPEPPHLAAAYARFGWRRGEFPVAEELAAHLLSLPIFPGMTDGQVDAVTRAVREFFRG